MTRDDIIRMAREAGLHLPYWDDDQDPKTDPPLGWSCVSPIGKPLERFAALVSASEREACAQICDTESANESSFWEKGGWAHACGNCAALIRARGQA